MEGQARRLPALPPKSPASIPLHLARQACTSRHWSRPFQSHTGCETITGQAAFGEGLGTGEWAVERRGLGAGSQLSSSTTREEVAQHLGCASWRSTLLLLGPQNALPCRLPPESHPGSKTSAGPKMPQAGWGPEDWLAQGVVTPNLWLADLPPLDPKDVPVLISGPHGHGISHGKGSQGRDGVEAAGS
jgi:hypothetical protein